MAVQWGRFFEELASAGRAARAHGQGITYWVPASQARAFAVIYPAAAFTTEVAPIDQSVLSREDALLRLVHGWMSHLGPIDETALARRWACPSRMFSRPCFASRRKEEFFAANTRAK